MREGDVIQALANVEISNVKDFDAVLAKFDKTKPLSVMFRRGDWVQFVVIRNPR
jgi:serine protease Do